EYCYQVRAYNADGTSAYTNTACATTDTGPTIPPPVSVPGAGLRVRLVANDLTPGEVASWGNRGSEADASQPTVSKRPVYYAPAAEFGGHASVGFNEGSDRDDVLEITGVSSHGSGTLIAVFRQEGASGHNYGLFGAWGSSASRSGMVTWRKSGGHLEYWDSSNGWTGGTGSPAGGVTYVGVWRVTGGVRADLFLNGAAAGSSPLSSSFPSFNRYTIGMTEPSSSTRFDGRVAEILFYDRAILDCERDDITAALGAQYGVSVSVPGGGCNPPSDPAGLSATAAGIDGIDLGWTDTSIDEDGFRIDRRLGQAGAWVEIATTPANQTSFGDAGLDPSTEYCYQVRSFNGNGNSGATPAACATTDAIGPLPPPVTVTETGLRLRLIANDLSAGDVTTWTNRGSEADAGQADAARRPTYDAPSTDFGGNASVAFNTGSDNDEALEVAGVASHGAGTLIAVFRQDDASGHNYGLFGAWGSSSSRAGMVTWANSTGGAFDYWDSSNGWVNGTTTVSANETYVGVWRVAGGGQADLQVNGSPAGSAALGFALPAFDRYVVGMTEPSTSARFDGRVAEILFYDRVLADCERDDIVALLGARYGVSVAVTGGGCNPPADPSGLSATPISYNQIDLAWTDGSSNEDAFRVERRLGQTGSWLQIALTAPNVQAYESRGLTQQTEYCYRVQASNADGFSGYTNISCATTQTAPPGACVDSGNHDDLSLLYGIQAIGAPANETWASTQTPGCEITPWYFGLDSGVDSDHPDLNVVEATNFVSAEVGHNGEDGHGHGTHTAGTAAAIDGNGGVVGVAPGAPIHSFRVCEDGGSCESADMIAAMDEVVARKQASPAQPMVANMSIGGPIDAALDAALRGSINAGIVYAVSAGNGALGACLFPANASGVSPARVGDDEIDAFGGSAGDNGLINGVLTTTSHNSAFADVN
ncbi:MAG: S8 family serine peptidase, partial [Gemmatimonadota bacterium]|nr:S8 family serine peptidase [Gemmatimonadota bacterium]